MVQTMVLPCDASRCKVDTTDWAIKESRPEVGSSANRIEGSVSTWRQMIKTNDKIVVC